MAKYFERKSEGWNQVGFGGKTKTLDHFEIDVVTVGAGQPLQENLTQKEQEEFILVKEGNVAVAINGQEQILARAAYLLLRSAMNAACVVWTQILLLFTVSGGTEKYLQALRGRHREADQPR